MEITIDLVEGRTYEIRDLQNEDWFSVCYHNGKFVDLFGNEYAPTKLKISYK